MFVDAIFQGCNFKEFQRKVEGVLHSGEIKDITSVGKKDYFIGIDGKIIAESSVVNDNVTLFSFSDGDFFYVDEDAWENLKESSIETWKSACTS